MFSHLRNFFRKKSGDTSPSETLPVHGTGAMPYPVRNESHAAAPVMPVPRVETAQLQLAALIAKFPEELRKLVLKQPPPEAMVALPLPTIQKFLPTGSVKMSLASVVRQAPPGTFAQINTGDKRLVEVPLAEIFKRISPAVLKKRDAQRFNDLAAEGFDIFGDEENPHALVPRFDGASESTPTLGGVRTPTPIPAAAPRALQPPLGMGPIPPAGVPAAQRAPVPPPIPTQRIFQQASPKPPMVEIDEQSLAIGAERKSPETANLSDAGPAVDQPPLVVPVKDLAQGWPEPIKSEAISLNGTTVSLPSAHVSLGLAKGKVAFYWGQLRSWMTPPPSTATGGDENMELLLPLRVIAPAFLKHTRQVQQRKSVSLDETIPALFGPSAGAPLLPTAEPTVAEAPALRPPPEAPVAPPADPNSQGELNRVQETPEPVPALEQIPAPAPAPAPAPLTFVAPREMAAPEPSPIVSRTDEVHASPPPASPPQEERAGQPPRREPLGTSAQPRTLGEAFGEDGKIRWSPSEIVAHLVKLPTIAGAAIALQEGLVVAHHLPDPMKGEVFAAFLPQIFARLGQYANEMKLGAVQDILIQSGQGPCHVFRLGQVYFAALGKIGEPLPTSILRLCVEALSDQ